MQVEEYEPTPLGDVLAGKMAQQHRFAAAGFAEDSDVLGAFAVRNGNGSGTDPAVDYQVADTKTAVASTAGTPAAQPVPYVRDGLIDEVAHDNLRLVCRKNSLA